MQGADFTHVENLPPLPEQWKVKQMSSIINLGTKCGGVCLCIIHTHQCQHSMLLAISVT